MTTSLREILASFTVDMGPAAKELQRGNSLVDGLVDKVLGFGKILAGAFAVDAVLGFANGLLQEADALAKASQGLGLAASELQELEHAAGLSGVSVELLRTSLQRLQRTAADAADGGGDSGKAFKKLGIELKNADGTAKTSGQLFEAAAEGIAAIENPTERAGVANQLFGRSYARLIPLLAEGGEGLRKLRAEVGELGFAFDDAFLKNAQEYNDNVDRLKAGVKGLAIQALGPLLPDMVRFSQVAVATIKEFVAWARQTKLVSALLTGLSAKGVLVLIGRLGGLAKAFGVLRGIVLRTLMPFLILEDLLVFLAGGGSVIGDALEHMFGTGASEKTRESIMGFMTELKRAINDDVLPALRAFNEVLLAPAVKLALETLAAVLAGIGVMFAKDGASADQAGQRMAKNLDAATLSANKLRDGLVESDNVFSKLIKSAGDFGTAASKALGFGGEEEGKAFMDKMRGDGKSAERAQNTPVGQAIRQFFGFGEGKAPQLPPALAAPTMSVASLPVAPQITSHVESHPTINQTIQLPPGTPAETVRRAGDAAKGKTLEALDTKALQAALVPTPG